MNFLNVSIVIHHETGMFGSACLHTKIRENDDSTAKQERASLRYIKYFSFPLCACVPSEIYEKNEVK